MDKETITRMGLLAKALDHGNKMVVVEEDVKIEYNPIIEVMRLYLHKREGMAEKERDTILTMFTMLSSPIVRVQSAKVSTP